MRVGSPVVCISTVLMSRALSETRLCIIGGVAIFEFSYYVEQNETKTNLMNFQTILRTYLRHMVQYYDLYLDIKQSFDIIR